MLAESEDFLSSELVLCEWECCRNSEAYSGKAPSKLSFFIDVFCFGDRGEGVVVPLGDRGESPLGVWLNKDALDCPFPGLSISLTVSIEPFRDCEPRK